MYRHTLVNKSALIVSNNTALVTCSRIAILNNCRLMTRQGKGREMKKESSLFLPSLQDIPCLEALITHHGWLGKWITYKALQYYFASTHGGLHTESCLFFEFARPLAECPRSVCQDSIEKRRIPKILIISSNNIVDFDLILPSCSVRYAMQLFIPIPQF